MRTRIKKTHVLLTPEVEQYLQKKLESLENIFKKEDSNALWEIELTKELKSKHSAKLFRAEFHIVIKGDLYRAEAYGETIMAAIDEAKDELKEELRKRSSKKKKAVKKDGQRAKKFLRKGLE